MSAKHNIFHGKFVKHDKVLKPLNKEKYKLFLDSMGDGDIADVFLEYAADDGSLAQIAKIHACIRELAKETGATFEDMKLEIKRKSGLCVKHKFDNEWYMICKSFGDASKDELSLVIQTIIQVGEVVGINFN